MSDFAVDRIRPDGRRPYCKSCDKLWWSQAKFKLTPEFKKRRYASTRKHAYRVRYGLTIDQVEELKSKQHNVCAICSKPCTTELAVDHDHLTGKIRGLLCRKCNRGLGCFEDNSTYLRIAANYLEV